MISLDPKAPRHCQTLFSYWTVGDSKQRRRCKTDVFSDCTLGRNSQRAHNHMHCRARRRPHNWKARGRMGARPVSLKECFFQPLYEQHGSPHQPRAAMCRVACVRLMLRLNAPSVTQAATAERMLGHARTQDSMHLQPIAAANSGKADKGNGEPLDAIRDAGSAGQRAGGSGGQISGASDGGFAGPGSLDAEMPDSGLTVTRDAGKSPTLEIQEIQAAGNCSKPLGPPTRAVLPLVSKSALMLTYGCLLDRTVDNRTTTTFILTPMQLEAATFAIEYWEAGLTSYFTCTGTPAPRWIGDEGCKAGLYPCALDLSTCNILWHLSSIPLYRMVTTCIQADGRSGLCAPA
jgi:hypothetical protein